MENPLVKKLKIKEGQQLLILDDPPGYLKKLSPLPQGTKVITAMKNEVDWAQIFVKNQVDMDALFPKVLKLVKPEGLIWISYPKVSSGVQTDLTRDKGWDNIMKYDLQWLSLISIDDIWSGFAMRNAKTKHAKPVKLNTDIARYIDTENKIVVVPPVLQKAFEKSKKAKQYYDSLAYSHRKEYVIWILDAKQEETKKRRVELTIEKLLSGLKNPADKG